MAGHSKRPASKAPLSPFERFLKGESTAGMLLFLAAGAGFAWANTPWAERYFELLKTYIGVSAGAWSLKMSVGHWINDGLMAVFFLLVGLELKRELLIGRLSSPRKAFLAIAVAIGGMVVPAAVYWALNPTGDAARGWGIPMATDIAFAIGVISLLGSRVPIALKVLLTAAAIVDDLGAVLVIAIFYTADLNSTALGIAGAVWVMAWLASLVGVRHLAIYLLLGLVMWYFVLESGVHATVAGVMIAMTVPIRRSCQPDVLESAIRHEVLEGEFESVEARVEQLEHLAEQAQTPLHRLEHAIHPWVTYLVLPIFAIANAGVSLSGAAHYTSPVVFGVLLGLLVGKPAGVLLSSWVTVRSGAAELPEGCGWRQMTGLGLLMGIGFTMALFIAGLAFSGDTAGRLDEAKLGLLAASLLAAVLGLVWLAGGSRREGTRRERAV